MAQTRTGLSAAAALTLACSPLPLLAPATGWAQVEEIIVSVRKRDESLQDVPIAISAITAQDLERKQINSLGDITKSLASVAFDEGSSKSDTRITIRGLSPTRGRQNVAILVDGIDVSTEAISNSGGGVLLNTRSWRSTAAAPSPAPSSTSPRTRRTSSSPPFPSTPTSRTSTAGR